MDIGDNGTVEVDSRIAPPFRRLAGRGNPATDRTWEGAVKAGRLLWDQLQSVLQSLPLSDKSLCNVDERWDVVLDDQSKGDILSVDFDDITPEAVLKDRSSEAWYTVSMNSREENSAYEFYYEVGFAPTLRAINSIFTYGNSWTRNGYVRAPDRWSDVVWAYWQVMCKRANTDPSELYWIFRQFITNGYSLRIIDKIFSGSQYISLPADEPYMTVVRPGDEAFFALLKTPNVVGVVYMLMDYSHGLHRKTIKDIIVKSSPEDGRRSVREYYLIIELEDASPQVTLESASGAGIGTIDTD